MSKFIFLLVIISFSAACGFFIGQQTKSSASSETPVLSATPVSVETKKPGFLKMLKDEKIISFQNWGDNGYFAIIRRLNEPCDKDYDLNSCEKLSIYDETGKVLYELKDIGINSIDFARLKPNSSQLIIETNGGGTDEFLKIVDYTNGKFIELDASEETQLRGGWWTMPEYRSGIETPYFKPAQLITIQQGGGADANPSAAVFRYKNNKFQRVGEFKMQELGDFIERQISKKQ